MANHIKRAAPFACTNHGAVTNMPNDAFLELRCDIDLSGDLANPLFNFDHAKAMKAPASR